MGDEFQIWKRHFIDQARGVIPHQRNFYKVSNQKGKGEGENIKMVAPTQQILERAKASLSDPPVVYDPVTGITNQPIYAKKTNRKRKNSSLKNKKTKKIKKSAKQTKKTQKPTKKKKKKKKKTKKKTIQKGKGKKKQWWDM